MSPNLGNMLLVKLNRPSVLDYGPGRTSVKCCLFYKKMCQQVGFSSATDLSDIVKNERNVPNVQRCRHLKLPSSGPRQNVTKNQKSYLTVTHDANSI